MLDQGVLTIQGSSSQVVVFLAVGQELTGWTG